MNLKNFPLLFSTMVFGGACQNNEYVESVDESPVVTIVANIGEKPVPSRYVHDTPTDNASFSVNDKIGVFMDDDKAVQWDFDGSTWKTDNTMYWEDRTETHNFYAFYPYVDVEYKGQVPMPSLEGQDGTSTNLGKHDFLVATAEKAYSDNDGQVDFTFKHVSSLLKLTLENTGDLQNAIIRKITITKKGLLTAQTYSFVDVATTPSDVSIDVLVWESDEESEMVGDKSLYFIVNGASVQKTGEVASLVIEYSRADTGKHYTAQRSDFPLSPVAGCKHIFNIKINSDKQVVITGGTITGWQGEGSGEDIVINGQEKSDD